MRSYDELVKTCDAEIRAGKLLSATGRLSQINSAQVPRAWRLPLANLARRAGLTTLGLKLLQKVVDPKRRAAADPATDAEMAEYGVLLHRFGAQAEAMRVLGRVDVKRAPEALLFKAFCLFDRYDYAPAIPLLEEYIRLQAAPYANFVGKVNLNAALLWSENWDRALELVAENIAYARQHGYSRLQANGHELRGQILIYRREFAGARADLNEAAQLLGFARTSDSFFVRKWNAILDGLSERSVGAFERLRVEALRAREWETVREADRFRLLAAFDDNVFRRLMFGTPYSAYRALVTRTAKRALDGNDYFFGGGGGEVLDLRTGQFAAADDPRNLRPGGKCHLFLDALLKDFYRPTCVGSVFADLFPGEHFDIFNSPARVHQILGRCRKWLENSAVPARIVHDHGFYSLEVTGPFHIRLELERKPASPFLVDFEQLKSCFAPGVWFSARQARDFLGMPRTSFQRLIEWAVSERLLVCESGGKAFRYQVPAVEAAALKSAA